jgi:uncharacterized protein
MLPPELIVLRYPENKVVPHMLSEAPSNLEQIDDLIQTFQQHLWKPRERLQDALTLFEAQLTDYKQRRGLAHLLLSLYSTFETIAPLEPEALRKRVFLESAKFPPTSQNRKKVLETIAEQLNLERGLQLTEDSRGGKHAQFFREVSSEAVDFGLYADLEHRAVLTKFQAPSPLELLDRYNLSQAQGTLYRAFSLSLKIAPSTPETYQNLFKALKKHGLMYLVTGTKKKGFVIGVDGPSSLLRPSIRYGQAMAKLLPDLLPLQNWELEAILHPKLEWRKDLKEAYYLLKWDEGLKPPTLPEKKDSSEGELEDALFQNFTKHNMGWSISRGMMLLPYGTALIVPDLKFKHMDGRVVHLEILRFWEPQYLEKRIRALEGKGKTKVILAVSERYRLEGHAKLLPELAAKVLWFKVRLDIKEVLEWLEGLTPRVK